MPFCDTFLSNFIWANSFGYFLQIQHESDSLEMLNSICKIFLVKSETWFSVWSVPKFEVLSFCPARKFFLGHQVVFRLLFTSRTIYSFFAYYLDFFSLFKFSWVFATAFTFFLSTITHLIILFTHIVTSECTLSLRRRSMSSFTMQHFIAGWGWKYLNNDKCWGILFLTIMNTRTLPQLTHTIMI